MKAPSPLLSAAIIVTLALVGLTFFASHKPITVHSDTGASEPGQTSGTQTKAQNSVPIDAAGIWRWESSIDELTNKGSFTLLSEQWNPTETVYTQNKLTCEAPNKSVSREPPDVLLNLSIIAFDKAKQPLPFLWQPEPANFLINLRQTVTHIKFTRDGGKSLEDDSLVLGDYTNSISLQIGYFMDGDKLVFGGEPITGDFRIQLSTNSGQQVVIKIPAESQQLLRKYFVQACPKLGGGSMQLLFENSISLGWTGKPGVEWGKMYYFADGDFEFASIDGQRFHGVWYRDGRNLCVRFDAPAPADAIEASQCGIYEEFDKVEDYHLRWTKDGRVIILRLTAGHPTRSSTSNPERTADSSTRNSMAQLFGNTIVVRGPDGTEWLRLYYKENGTFRIVESGGQISGGTWVLDEKTLCRIFTYPKKIEFEKKCFEQKSFSAIGDVQDQQLPDGQLMTYTLQAGQP